MAINRWNHIDRINRSRFSSQTGYLAFFNGSFDSGDEVFIAGSAATVTADPDNIVSDDFGAGSLNAMWTFDGDGGSATVGESGDEKYAEISVPAGGYDAWNTVTAPHITQLFDNGNFDISIKNITRPTGDNQAQGIIIKEDDDNFVRLDTYHNGTNLYVFVGTNIGGVGTNRANDIVSLGDADYLRIVRTVGTTWNFYRSSDGDSWTNITQVTSLTLNAVSAGIWAGAGSGAYTAQFDYLFNAASPIAEEDGGSTRPTASGRSISVGTATDSVTFDRMAIMDAASGGNQVDTILLATPRNVKSGDTVTVNHGIVSIA